MIKNQKSFLQKLSYWSGVVVIGLLVGLSLQLARAAWSEPSVAPTGGNVAAPINISPTGQFKTGAFAAYSLGASGTGLALQVPNGNAIIGGNVGIGTTNPTQKLEVNGAIRTTQLHVTNGAAAGRVLTSDASGIATWQAPSGGGGTVTSITAGGGLTGGTITTSGTISITCPCGTCWAEQNVNIDVPCGTAIRQLCTPGGWRNTGNVTTGTICSGDGNDQITEDLEFLKTIIQNNKDMINQGLENGVLH